MGGRQTIENGNQYAYSTERPEDGGVITSLMDVFNNNIWLVETIARAATDNHWPRVDVKAGNVAPGINGGFQGLVKSPMNKGRGYRIPGVGLAGDWPGSWTQTFAQVDTEAGPHGFDEHYFMQQVAGLSQIAGDMMKVHPRVIDLGWGTVKSAIATQKDTAFAKPSDAAASRQALLSQYTAAFRQVESGAVAKGVAALKDLSAQVGKNIAADADQQHAVTSLIDAQIQKLA
jgi:hypothetical protein